MEKFADTKIRKICLHLTWKGLDLNSTKCSSMGILQLNKLPLNSQGSFTFTNAQKVWRYFIINKLRKWYQLQNHRWCRNLLENGKVRKKTLCGACAPLCRGDLILACHAKFLISIDMIQSMIHDLIHDPVMIRSAIRSGPGRSRIYLRQMIVGNSLILASNSTWQLHVREMEVGEAWKIYWVTKAQQLLSFSTL